jgi:biotin transport system substrate-specific component
MTMTATYPLSSSLSKPAAILKDIGVVLGASLVIALSGQLSIPLPFTPVPLVLQSHVILFFAAVLGSRRGFFAVLAFLMQGLMGLPVFASGSVGLLALLGPTGGYLLGYLIAAWTTGWMMENAKERTVKSTALALISGNLAIYLFGLPWLSFFIGFKAALICGFLPFIAGDFLKIVLTMKGLKRS